MREEREKETRFLLWRERETGREREKREYREEEVKERARERVDDNTHHERQPPLGISIARRIGRERG